AEADHSDASAEHGVEESAAPAPTLRKPCQHQDQDDACEKESEISCGDREQGQRNTIDHECPLLGRSNSGISTGTEGVHVTCGLGGGGGREWREARRGKTKRDPGTMQQNAVVSMGKRPGPGPLTLQVSRPAACQSNSSANPNPMRNVSRSSEKRMTYPS